MADGEVYAENLTEETASTLDGTEYYVMFDGVEGKKTLLSVIADYVANHGKINGDDIPTLLTAIGNKIGTLSNLNTTTKTNLVAAINELVSDVSNIDSSIAPAYSSSSTYAVGDMVVYSNKLYVCTTAITTAETWTEAHWTAVTISSELADLKEDFNALGFSVVNGELCQTYNV